MKGGDLIFPLRGKTVAKRPVGGQWQAAESLTYPPPHAPFRALQINAFPRLSKTLS